MRSLNLVSVIALFCAGGGAGLVSSPPVSARAPQDISGSLLHLPPAKDAGTQKAQQALEQMVAALGGEEYLNLRDMEIEGRTYTFYHGDPEGAGVQFWRFWQWPDKDRQELTKQRDVKVIFNGNDGFEITYKGTRSVEKEQLEDFLRRRSHSLQWVLRKWLHEPGVVLLYEGQTLAERKQADQVSVVNSENDTATIWIDSNTHLPLKIGYSWRDPADRFLNQDSEGYDNYRPVQGIPTPFSVTRYRNGDLTNQRFILNVKYNQNLPGAMFAAKLTDPAKKTK